PRPGDLPVARAKGIVHDSHSSSRSYYHYSYPAGVRSNLFGTYVGVPVSQATFFYATPLSIVSTQPIVILPPTPQNREVDRTPERVPPPRADALAPFVPEAMAPGAPASVYRPIRPEDRARARVPEVPEPARPAQPPREPPPLPGAPAAPAEPKLASARHVESGKEAFQAQQYSRAERRF